MKNSLPVLILLLSITARAQKSYEDSIHAFLQQYVQTHEVVKGEDRNALRFYPVDKAYRVVAQFTKAAESQWLSFPTSGNITKVFKVYGTLDFELNGKPLRFNVYQSQELQINEAYKQYLFLPFTDSTTGNETYEGGRYLDLTLNDFQTDKVLLDFNKAYNPYCAYVSGKYNCPVPPRENALPVAVRAGEKAFGKQH